MINNKRHKSNKYIHNNYGKNKINKKYIINKLVLLGIMVMMLINTFIPPNVFASEEHILGVPLQKFDQITNTNQRLESILEYYEDNKDRPGYLIKYMQDTYAYMYAITNLAEQLGTNENDIIPEHVKNYNKNLKPPLTDEDQIEAEYVTVLNQQSGTESEVYTVKTSSDTAKDKLKSLLGKIGEDSENLTYYSLIGKVREGIGYSADLTVTEQNKSEKAVSNYLKSNISEIRYLFTSAKEFIVEYGDILNSADLQDFTDYFIDTYDKVIKFSYENEIDVLKDLNLFGERTEDPFDATQEGAEKFIGKWKIETVDKKEKAILEEYSEHILKNIAASATFRPFETNLNNLSAFDFMGDSAKKFHEEFGTKRKMLLTVSGGSVDVNDAMNPQASKNLKFMTLRDFVENPNKPKILYLDNLEYTLAEIEEAQNIISGDEENTSDNETSMLAEETNKDNNKGFFGKITDKVESFFRGTALYNTTVFVKDIFSKNGVSNMEKNIETIVFASANINDVIPITKSVDKKKEDINEGYLIYNNIIEEYYNNRYGNRIKMRNDLDKPMYIDIYGNIVSASGIVIIPAVSNPFLFKDTEPTLHFNRAFIESYPKYTVKNNNITFPKKEKNKLMFALNPMDRKGVEKQEDDLELDLSDIKSELDSESIEEVKEIFKEALEESESKTEEETERGNQEETEEGVEVKKSGVSGLEIVSNLEGDSEFKAIPAVDYYVVKANKIGVFKEKLRANYIKPIANKFDEDYNPSRALNVWSFVKADEDLEDYRSLRNNVRKLPQDYRLALIDEYTARLTYAESESIELIRFLEVPDSKEVKRFIYITNLENLVKIESNEIKDKHVLDPDVANKITSEVYVNGVYDTNLINSLVPDFVRTIYEEYIKFTLDKANNRYESVLSNKTDNHLLYSKGIEEIKMLKGVLPLVYRVLLIIAIVAIIMNIILTVIVPEGRFKKLMKVLIVLYLVTFLFNISGWVIETFVNKPTAKMFTSETVMWTLMEQEKNAHKLEKKSDEEVDYSPVEEGSQIKLFRIPIKYPYQLLTSSQPSSALTIDEYYEYFLNNDGRFRLQNNEMYVDGKYLATNTNTIFESSSIVVEDPNDVHLKLKHEIYVNPELAYYLPYYMFIDNIVYNLNQITELTGKIPNDVAYASGEVKTTGRIHSYINSAMFLNYDEYLQRISQYESSDKVDELLAVEKILEVTEKYGNPDDFLGIRKILLSTTDEDLKPFTLEGIAKVQNTGWYPQMPEVMTEGLIEEWNSKALKVNDKVKKFMMELAEVSDKIADEHLIKTIALYASLEFNKEFGKYAINKGPTAIELKQVPIENLLMALSVEREELINNSITTYPNYVLEKEGYWGLLIASINDFIIVFINFMKPLMIVIIWSLTAFVIFTKKIILPDNNNRSISGSLKVMVFFVVTALLYNLGLLGIIKLINIGNFLILGQLLLLVINLVYVFLIVVILWSVFSDIWNLGNSVVFKGLEGITKSFSEVFKSTLKSIPIVDKYFGHKLGPSGGRIENLSKYYEQKSIKYGNNITGDIGIRRPIDFSMDTMNLVRTTASQINQRRKTRREGQINQIENKYLNQNTDNDFFVDLPQDRYNDPKYRTDNFEEYQRKFEEQSFNRNNDQNRSSN